MDNTKNPFGVSYIQTSAGAMITGEIKRYATYREMMEETAPTRLASVANASRDHEQFIRGELEIDYPVPQEHSGGILYQRDFINSTWILLYTDADLSIPTMVEWDNILHVPPWVGGVSNNRVKLVQDSYAVPRTTYYSFGNYRLVLPPANHKSVKLGDEIVLEQYNSYGWVLYERVEDSNDPNDPQNSIAYDQETITIDGVVYNILFTVPYYEFEVDPSNQNPVYGQPITACAYKFICTETDGGTRCWKPILLRDNINALIADLRQRDTDHILAADPHPNYILKREARNYLWSNVKTATEFDEGKVRLALQEDVENGTNGPIVVTPYQLKQYYSPKIHTQSFTTITDVPFVITIKDSNKEQEDTIVTPKALTVYTDTYYTKKGHPHVAADITDLSTELAKKQNVLKNGTYISIVDDTVNCTIPPASLADTGIVRLTDSVTDDNKDDTTTAVTPKALSQFIAASEISGFITAFTDISNGATTFPFTTGTRGCVITPFVYELDNVKYNIALEWGLSRQFVTQLNEPRYFMMHVPGYCKFRKIMFVNMAIMPIGETDGDITSMHSTVTTLSYHRYKDSASGTTISDANNYVAAILLWFNQFTAAGIHKPVRLKWFAIGLVNPDVVWPVVPQDTGVTNETLDPYTNYFTNVKKKLELTDVAVPSVTNYLLDSCYEQRQLEPVSLVANASIERVQSSTDSGTWHVFSDDTMEGNNRVVATKPFAGNDHPRAAIAISYTFTRARNLETMYEYHISGLYFKAALSGVASRSYTVTIDELYIVGTSDGKLKIDTARSSISSSKSGVTFKLTDLSSNAAKTAINYSSKDLWSWGSIPSSTYCVIGDYYTDYDDYIDLLYFILGYDNDKIIMKVLTSSYAQKLSSVSVSVRYTKPEYITHKLIPIR